MIKKNILKNKVAVITGGAGLLGEKHAEAIAELGGNCILFDKNNALAKKKAKKISRNFSVKCFSFAGKADNEQNVKKLVEFIDKKFGRLDILINNAALNPKPKKNSNSLENYNIKNWDEELSAGITSAFVCSKILGKYILIKSKKGVIINISSDLGLIAPNQNLYAKGYKKPASYSVIKHGIIGLTKYLATYWGHKGIRTNCVCPGSVYDNHDKKFVKKINKLIPLNRMARSDEYKGAIQFLASDASSYMNGATLIIDGGRTIW